VNQTEVTNQQEGEDEKELKSNCATSEKRREDDDADRDDCDQCGRFRTRRVRLGSKRQRIEISPKVHCTTAVTESVSENGNPSKSRFKGRSRHFKRSFGKGVTGQPQNLRS
jgi:hypothetical protein